MTIKTKPRIRQVFVSVPYIPTLTERITLKRAIDDEKTHIARKSKTTLLHTLFRKEKARTEKLQVDNVVYELSCIGNAAETCNKVYVGTTKRKLGVRISEHEYDVRKGKETTALAQHVKETNHKVDFKSVKILDREKAYNKRYTLKSLRIQQRIKTSINTKEDKNQTKLQYSIAIV